MSERNDRSATIVRLVQFSSLVTGRFAPILYYRSPSKRARTAGRQAGALAPRQEQGVARRSNNSYRNRLLDRLSPGDLTLLAPHLERLAVGVRHSIEVRDRPIRHV
jgi:hypothetical protein